MLISDQANRVSLKPCQFLKCIRAKASVSEHGAVRYCKLLASHWSYLVSPSTLVDSRISWKRLGFKSVTCADDACLVLSKVCPFCFRAPGSLATFDAAYAL